MIKFSIKIKSIQRIPDMQLTDAQSKIIGNTAIQSLRDRVQNENSDLYNAPMESYSDRPVYVKLGTSKGLSVIKSGRIAIAKISALRRAGARITSSKVKIKSQGNKAIVNTGNSLRFKNRAAYKQFLGKSGRRDLTDTGAMLNAIIITGISGTYAKVITLSFRDSKQAEKALGNIKWNKGKDWFGLTPIQQLRIAGMVEIMIARNLGIPIDAAPRLSGFTQQMFVPRTNTGYSTP